MGHQTFDSQEKALEAAMKLEVVPKDDTLGGYKKFKNNSKPCTWRFRAYGRNREKELAQTSSAYDVGCMAIQRTNVLY